MAYPPAPISDFTGLVAVVTGGGTGMGRELVRQLAAGGASVATCDVSDEHVGETAELAIADAAPGVRVSTWIADVSDESQMLAFADHVRAEHGDHVNLLFNNAGIGGGSSLVVGDRAEWDRVFGVCFTGVLNGMRAFLPLLMAADRGHVVNTSSVNGLWACLGPVGAHSAYSAAKYAVRGLTEAAMVDFRVNAPHLTASVVMPGHIGTAIARNSTLEFGRDPKTMNDAAIAEARALIEARGVDTSGASDEDIRNLLQMRLESFENDAPTTAAEAATVILDAVRAGRWRVLIGQDADDIDRMVRDRPEEAYTDAFMDDLEALGHFGGLVRR